MATRNSIRPRVGLGRLVALLALGVFALAAPASSLAVVQGSRGPDRIVGNGGNNTIFSGRFADFIRGGFGDDAIHGGLG
jgi:Ca2+-binding RTX toxin-like protein